MIASDASFANNNTNCKSLQAFAIKLFSGLIGWRVNKQDTVTTLITKAKLLALAQAAKESMYVSKLLLKLIIDLND
jgi:Zn-dependent M16 (insulinase) family peptidase